MIKIIFSSASMLLCIIAALASHFIVFDLKKSIKIFEAIFVAMAAIGILFKFYL